MTKSEAQKKLGVGRSTSLRKAQKVYNDKRTELQRQLVPGMPRETREIAQDELLELTSAWRTVSAQPVCMPHRTRTISETTGRPKPPASTSAAGRGVPEGFWNDFLSLFPVSKSDAAAIVIAVLVLVLVWIVKEIL